MMRLITKQFRMERIWIFFSWSRKGRKGGIRSLLRPRELNRGVGEAVGIGEKKLLIPTVPPRAGAGVERGQEPGMGLPRSRAIP